MSHRDVREIVSSTERRVVSAGEANDDGDTEISGTGAVRLILFSSVRPFVGASMRSLIHPSIYLSIYQSINFCLAVHPIYQFESLMICFPIHLGVSAHQGLAGVGRSRARSPFEIREPHALVRLLSALLLLVLEEPASQS